MESDLNPLYRRVLAANAQLAQMSQSATVSIREVNQKKKHLQQAVHALFISGYTDRRKHRHYRSIGALLQGKEGILRQHLHGKRTNPADDIWQPH